MTLFGAYNRLPRNIMSAISDQAQYYRSYKQAKTSGQQFDFKTGQIIDPNAPPTNGGDGTGNTDGTGGGAGTPGQPFDPNLMMSWLAQMFPGFQGDGPTNWMPPFDVGQGWGSPFNGGIGNPFQPYPPQFSPNTPMDYYGFLMMWMMIQQQNEGGIQFETELPRRNPTGFTRDPFMQGNEGMDMILDLMKVDEGERSSNTDNDDWHFSDADIAQLQQGLANGTFTQKELGMAITAKMRRINEGGADEFQGLITKLIDQKILNPRALFTPYLREMNEDKQGMVMQAIANAGQTSMQGEFIQFLMMNVNNENRPELRDLLQDLVLRFYNTHTTNPNTNVTLNEALATIQQATTTNETVNT